MASNSHGKDTLFESNVQLLTNAGSTRSNRAFLCFEWTRPGQSPGGRRTDSGFASVPIRAANRLDRLFRPIFSVWNYFCLDIVVTTFSNFASFEKRNC